MSQATSLYDLVNQAKRDLKAELEMLDPTEHGASLDAVFHTVNKYSNVDAATMLSILDHDPALIFSGHGDYSISERISYGIRRRLSAELEEVRREWWEHRHEGDYDAT